MGAGLVLLVLVQQRLVLRRAGACFVARVPCALLLMCPSAREMHVLLAFGNGVLGCLIMPALAIQSFLSPCLLPRTPPLAPQPLTNKLRLRVRSEEGGEWREVTVPRSVRALVLLNLQVGGAQARLQGSSGTGMGWRAVLWVWPDCVAA